MKHKNYSQVLLLMASLCWVPASFPHSWHDHGNDDHTEDMDASTVQHQRLMEARKSFSPVATYKRLGKSGRRYTMKYDGPSRYYKSVRFGLYPSVGKARVYSVLTGWFYAGREYPVTFECKGVKSKSDDALRLLLDQVEQ
ncbi:MAG: hypothetical protein IME93_01540 [Proteobacteria bacterium]|nr:hypothetical protein [Pseudomonadota bacterium]